MASGLVIQQRTTGGFASTAQMLRNAALAAVIFYPFKSLINIPFLVFFKDSNSADYLHPVIFFVTVSLIGLSFIANHRASQLSKLDVALAVIGALLLVIAFTRQDERYIFVIMLVFMLPIFFSNLAHGDNKVTRNIVMAFFIMVVIYMTTEHVVLHTHLYGITSEPFISAEELATYQSSLATGYDYDSALRNIIDYRHTGTQYGELYRLRTGGFVTNTLVMPTILSMTAIFFYVSLRESGRRWLILLVILSGFVLLNSVSTTGVTTFFVGALFYELYFARRVRQYWIPLVLLMAAVFLVLYYDPIAYLYNRFLDRSSQLAVDYTAYNPIFSADILRSVVGYQGMGTAFTYFTSSNEMIRFATAVGLIPTALVFWRWLRPVIQGRELRNIDMRVYGMTAMVGILGTIHAGAVFSLNVFLLIAFLNIQAFALMRMATRSVKEMDSYGRVPNQ